MTHCGTLYHIRSPTVADTLREHVIQVHGHLPSTFLGPAPGWALREQDTGQVPSEQGARDEGRGPSGHSWPNSQAGKGPECNPGRQLCCPQQQDILGQPRGSWGRDRGSVGGCSEQGKGLAMGCGNQAKSLLCGAKRRHSGTKDRDPRVAYGARKEQGHGPVKPKSTRSRSSPWLMGAKQGKCDQAP